MQVSNLKVLTGPAGVGKTTSLIEAAKSWPKNSAVLAYSRSAAEELSARGISAPSGTIHSVTWPHVKLVAGVKVGGSRTRMDDDYKRRKIRDTTDLALSDWVRSAPGNSPQNVLEQELLGWYPELGPAPEWLWTDPVPRGMSHSVALARWLDKGAPMNENEGLKELEFLAIDEAQDVSALELAAALKLVSHSGTALAVGDPGQAIFQGHKGGEESELPPAWVWASESDILEKGYRCGYPVADAAAEVLRPYFEIPPEAFRAAHETTIHLWDPETHRPMTGLVLGHSRLKVEETAKRWDLTNFSVTPATTQEGGLNLSTIHAAKGTQAEDVYLLPWSAKMMNKLRDDAPGCIKLLYVAMTRASRRLFLPMEMRLWLPGGF